MVRDRLSGALIQAWPQLERELQEVTFFSPIIKPPLWKK